MSARGNFSNKLEAFSHIMIDLLHLDYMDDFDLVEAIQRLIKLNKPFDLHIVSDNALSILSTLNEADLLQVPRFIFVQIENLPDFKRQQLSPYKNVFVAMHVDTQLDKVFELDLSKDAILLMTTIPGKSGGVLSEKIYSLVANIKKQYPVSKIYVDGGVSNTSFQRLQSLGVHTVVIGSYLLEAKNTSEKIGKLHCRLDENVRLGSISDKINHLPITNDTSLKNILRVMNKTKSNYVIISDDYVTISGIITDGDIKRGLEQTLRFNDFENISIRPNVSFRTLNYSDTISNLISAGLSEARYGVIPIVGKLGLIDEAIDLKKI